MKAVKITGIVCMAIIFIAFFLPWVSVESTGMVGDVLELVTGERQVELNVDQTLSGYDVPLLANSERSRLAGALLQIFFPNIENADQKSYLIWAVPVLPVLLWFISVIFFGKAWVHAGTGVIALAVFAVASYQLMTVDLDHLVFEARIRYGLWMVVAGYLAFGLTEFAAFVKVKK